MSREKGRSLDNYLLCMVANLHIVQVKLANFLSISCMSHDCWFAFSYPINILHTYLTLNYSYLKKNKMSLILIFAGAFPATSYEVQVISHPSNEAFPQAKEMYSKRQVPCTI